MFTYRPRPECKLTEINRTRGDSAFDAPNSLSGRSTRSIFFLLSIMASDTSRTSVNGVAMSASDSTSQVRVQLSTRHSDISLPENPGPILVNTSNVIWELFGFVPTKEYTRSPAICPFYPRKYSVAVREAHTIRIPNQWHISPNIVRRIPYREWHICRDYACSRVCACYHTAALSYFI